jgi:hypothetical protein
VTLALIASLLAAAPTPFDASFNAAKGLYDRAEWDATLRQLAQAEALAKTDAQRANVLLFEGAVQANIPDPDAAEATWARALALTPNAELPVRVAPKIQTEFNRVRALANVLKPKPTDAPVAPPPAAAPIPAPLPPPAAAVEQQPAGFHVEVASVVSLCLAAAAGGTGVTFGVLSSQQVTSARQAFFEDEKLSHYGQAKTFSDAANISYAVAGAAVLIAVLFQLLLR